MELGVSDKDFKYFQASGCVSVGKPKKGVIYPSTLEYTSSKSSKFFVILYNKNNVYS